jgi:tetratricopeptide (TPR) repeat protein
MVSNFFMKRTQLIFVVLLALPQSYLAGQDALLQASRDRPSVQRPQARSQQESDAYHAASGVHGGGAIEKAASNFATKYPDSELRRYLFSKAMREYQRENNPGGMLAMGEKVLALDPSHSLALVLTATALADSLADGDRDRDQKIAEIKKNAGRVIQNADTGLAAPAAAGPEQVALYRTALQSMAYSALGIVNLKTGDYAEAEKDLKAAADLAKAHPDPYVWYHLALAQDYRMKYPAALNSVEQALQLASANPELQRLAETEHGRLIRLAGRRKDSPDSGETRPPE